MGEEGVWKPSRTESRSCQWTDEPQGAIYTWRGDGDHQAICLITHSLCTESDGGGLCIVVCPHGLVAKVREEEDLYVYLIYISILLGWVWRELHFFMLRKGYGDLYKAPTQEERRKQKATRRDRSNQVYLS